MDIYTYYRTLPLGDQQAEVELIKKWEKNWQSNGFDTHVLTPSNIPPPLYKKYIHSIVKFPSVNPRMYDFACFERWLAMAGIKSEQPILMSDYDCFVYGWDEKLSSELTVWGNYVPCVVSGIPSEFHRIFNDVFSKHTVTNNDSVNGKPHISDMTLLQQYRDSYISKHIVREYDEKGWEKAPIVHYCTWRMTKHNLLPKHEYVDKLR